jgi:multiple sugar transport system substrate-binding protein
MSAGAVTSQSAPASSAAVAPAAQPGTVHLGILWSNGSGSNSATPEVTAFEQVAKLYAQKNSGLAATIDQGMDNAKVLTQLAGGAGPDLFMVDSTGALGGFVTKGAVVDLTALFAQDSQNLLKQFLPQTVNAMTVTGKQYATAATVTSSGLYYNKRVFQEGGVAEPTTTWNWNDLRGAAQKLTKHSAQGTMTQAGYVPDSITLSWSTGPTTWVWSNGGSFFNADQTKFTLGDKPAVEALQTFIDLLFKDKVIPTDADVKAENLKGTWEFMEQGQGAMFESPSWNASWLLNRPQYQKVYQDLYIQTSPRSPNVDKPAVEFGFSRMLAMNVNTKVKDAAWRLATFIDTDDDAILTGGLTGSGMPALPAKFPVWLKIVGTGRGQEIFTKNIGQVRYAEHLQADPTADDEIWKLLNTGWGNVTSQKTDVAGFLQSVTPPIEQALAGKK